MTGLALQVYAWWRGIGFNHNPENLRLGNTARAMRLEKRKAAFLIVLMGLALEAAVTPGAAAAEEIERLEEHAGVQIFRGLDGDAEFQEPLLSRQPRPSPEQPEKEEAREEQREPPEGRPKEPRGPTGSVVCNVADRLAGRCISNITVHRAGRADNAGIVVHRAGQSDNRFQRVHRAGRSDHRFQRVHRAGGSDQSRIRVHGVRDRLR